MHSVDDQLCEVGHAEALRLLGSVPVGRIGFVAGDEPYVLPVNISTDDEGRVVFRTGDHSLLSELAGRKVAVEVDGYETATRTGWCVLVRGVAREITSDHDVAAERLRRLDVVPWVAGSRDRWFAVLPLAISGRRIVHPDPAVEDWFAGIPGS